MVRPFWLSRRDLGLLALSSGPERPIGPLKVVPLWSPNAAPTRLELDVFAEAPQPAGRRCGFGSGALVAVVVDLDSVTNVRNGPTNKGSAPRTSGTVVSCDAVDRQAVDSTGAEATHLRAGGRESASLERKSM